MDQKHLAVGLALLRENLDRLVILTLGMAVVQQILLFAAGAGAEVVDEAATPSPLPILVLFAASALRTGLVLAVLLPRAFDEPGLDNRAVLQGALGIWLPLVGVDALTLGATMIGLFLLIIPGIIVAVRLAFAGAVLYREKLTPIASLQRSWKLTDGRAWELFLAIVAASLPLLIGTTAIQALQTVTPWLTETGPQLALRALLDLLTLPIAAVVIAAYVAALREDERSDDLRAIFRSAV